MREKTQSNFGGEKATLSQTAIFNEASVSGKGNRGLSLSTRNEIKAIIHREKKGKYGSLIFVRSYRLPDKTMSRRTLVKADVKTSKAGEEYLIKFRGFNMDDLLILKKNWGNILKAMVL